MFRGIIPKGEWIYKYLARPSSRKFMEEVFPNKPNLGHLKGFFISQNGKLTHFLEKNKNIFAYENDFSFRIES